MIFEHPSNKSESQNWFVDCSAELVKSAIHSALVNPLNSVRQICGQSQLDWSKPDDNATGAKAVSQHIGDMAGNIFDFMVLKKIVGGIAGEGLLEKGILATKLLPSVTARSIRLSAITGLGQGYLFTPVVHGNTGLFSDDRFASGVISAGSMVAMDLTPHVRRNIPQNFVGNLGRSTTAGAAGGISQVLLSDGLFKHQLGLNSETASRIAGAAFGGALGGAAFHISHTALGLTFRSRVKQTTIESNSSDNSFEELSVHNTSSFDSQLLQSAKLHLSKTARDNDPHNVQSGYVEDSSGRIRHVVIRCEHRPMEELASVFHKLTPFTCAIPEVANRNSAEPLTSCGGIDVQQRIGKSLCDRVRNGSLTVRKKVNEDRVVHVDLQLYDQLEQATAERIIIGDIDGDPRNMTASRQGGKWTVANIDFDNGRLGAFSDNPIPQRTRSPLDGQPISKATLAKTRQLVDTLDTPAGRNSLQNIGLGNKQSDALIARARFLLEYKHFPKSPAGVATDPLLSSNKLREMAENEDIHIRHDAAKNPAASPDLLSKLAADEEYFVRSAVAGNPVASADLLRKLATDKNVDVRCNVAINSAASFDLLTHLSADECYSVQLAVAENPSASPELLSKLLKQWHKSSKQLIANVASNPSFWTPQSRNR